MYNKEKDKLIKYIDTTNDKGDKLCLLVYSYNNGEPKLQISRVFSKKDGSTSYGKVGRLNIEEVSWINDCLDLVLTYMK